ncbi:MAG: ribonuclease domain-containing protein [Candidatus Brachytrichaceae bacterium NZ_4S206]
MGHDVGSRRRLVVALTLWCLVIAGLIASCSAVQAAPQALAPVAAPTASSAQTVVVTPSATVRPTITPRTRPARIDGLPVVFVDELPREAQQTLALIRRGGPFPYRQDGTIFQNRERRLPIKPRGYYREYTVRTPGERDRGARRIVMGAGGEIYYTADHYESFVRVIEP